MTLAQKTAKGILWTGSSTAIVTTFQFIILASLARLLSPSDFGLMGIITLVIGLVTMIADCGLGTAVIQNKNVTKEQLSTFFFLNIFFGITICSIVFFTSGLVASFFKNSELINLLKAISFVFILISFGQTFRTLLQKQMNFKSLAKVEIFGTFIYGISSISLAIKGFGVWSLVYGFLLRHLSETILLWIVTAFIPQLCFNLKKISDLLNFGIYVFGERVINYFNRNLDNIIIGRVLGAEALGYYTLAYQLMLFPLQKISHTVAKVVFPTLSIVQDDNKQVQHTYLKTVKYISLVTFPMMAGLFCVATEFINSAYGIKWQPTILVLQILCFIGALQSIQTTVGTVLYAKGRSDIAFKWSVFALICYATAFFTGVKWGIVGIATAYAIVSIILFPIIQSITNRLIELRWSKFFKQFINQAIGITFLIIAIFSTKLYLTNKFSFTQIYILLISIIIGLIVYISVILIADKNALIEDIKIMKFTSQQSNPP